MKLYCVTPDEKKGRELLASCASDLIVERLWLQPDVARSILRKGWDGKTWEIWLLPLPTTGPDGLLERLVAQHKIPGDPLEIFQWNRFPQRRGIIVLEGDASPSLPELFPFLVVPRSKLGSLWSSLLATARLGFYDVRDRLSAALIKPSRAPIDDRVRASLGDVPPVRKDLTSTAVDLIVRALGSPKDPLLVAHLVHHLSHLPGAGGDPSSFREESEILAGVTLARTFAYLASRTFEGVPLQTGLVAASREAIREADDTTRLRWVFRFPRPVQFDLAPASETERLAQLADGSSSMLVADFLGRVHGLAGIEGQDISDLCRSFGGYVFRTTANGGVTMFCCGHPVVHFNGFEWHRDLPRDQLRRVTSWALTSADTRAALRARAFVNLLEELSLRRLPSILAICERDVFEEIQQRRIVQPLRHDLEGVTWSRPGVPQEGLIGILRLDGAHFLSRELDVLAVCQDVAVPRSVPTQDLGTGTRAARYLSRLMGARGYTVKVSSDGPIRVFHRGSLLG